METTQTIRFEGWETVTDVSERLGIDRSQITRYCQDGRLKAKKLGNYWLIEEGDTPRAPEAPQRPGRPPKWID